MPLCMYDDAKARTFEPFALTRPLGEMRAGAALIRRRWERVFGEPCTSFIGAPHLARFEEAGAPGAADRDVAGLWVVNTRCIVALDATIDASADVVTCRGAVAAVRLRGSLPVAELRAGAVALDALAPAGGVTVDVAGRWLVEVWDFIGTLQVQLGEDVPALAATLDTAAPDGAAVLGGGRVYVERGATVEPFVVFDTTA
jgi:UDP-N-acetylglucosamine diphosphorylase / glucose-1-phosphate thymidylyltransferase / UDP-N-acetylgalactosamine diphosphorylase / glucosamine-1-phosphate N-acetyltransferase / galactosamine-1-phosphate N-acetyltransferase